jgi:hypothetical protein
VEGDVSDHDREYYRRRAEEELVAANAAASYVAASVHRRLAEQYLALARGVPVRTSPDRLDLSSL